MLLIFRSTALSCGSIETSFRAFGPVSAAPAAGERLPPPVPDVAPEDCAVPALLVPTLLLPVIDGAVAALPAPLGSFAVLLMPPEFAGPAGTPLVAAVPAPAEPAAGEPPVEPPVLPDEAPPL